MAPLDYDLYLRVDSNTQGHRQWFYFSMRNTHPCTVKIRLLRFKKCYSLFQEACDRMLDLVLSPIGIQRVKILSIDLKTQ